MVYLKYCGCVGGGVDKQTRLSPLSDPPFLLRYTRNLVDEGNGRYNLIVLCWGEGHGRLDHQIQIP